MSLKEKTSGNNFPCSTSPQDNNNWASHPPSTTKIFYLQSVNITVDCPFNTETSVTGFNMIVILLKRIAHTHTFKQRWPGTYSLLCSKQSGVILKEETENVFHILAANWST